MEMIRKLILRAILLAVFLCGCEGALTCGKEGRTDSYSVARTSDDTFQDVDAVESACQAMSKNNNTVVRFHSNGKKTTIGCLFKIDKLFTWEEAQEA